MADEVTPTAEAEAPEQRGKRRVLRGVVVSDKMDKTIVLEVAMLKQHPLYGRTMRRSKRYKAHDAENVDWH